MYQLGSERHDLRPNWIKILEYLHKVNKQTTKGEVVVLTHKETKLRTTPGGLDV